MGDLRNVLSMMPVLAAVPETALEPAATVAEIARFVVFWIRATTRVFAAIMAVNTLSPALLARIRDQFAAPAVFAEFLIVRLQEGAQAFSVWKEFVATHAS